jgi:hypothetical protein
MHGQPTQAHQANLVAMRTLAGAFDSLMGAVKGLEWSKHIETLTALEQENGDTSGHAGFQHGLKAR